MKLPNATDAVIPKEKLSDYLLSPTHPIGRFKANFFRGLGFEVDDAPLLENALRGLLDGNAEVLDSSQFGRKYIIRGTIAGPSG